VDAPSSTQIRRSRVIMAITGIVVVGII